VIFAEFEITGFGHAHEREIFPNFTCATNLQTAKPRT